MATFWSLKYLVEVKLGWTRAGILIVPEFNEICNVLDYIMDLSTDIYGQNKNLLGLDL